jgi:hypothetical protein
LTTEESNPNRKPPIAPATARPMTRPLTFERAARFRSPD